VRGVKANCLSLGSLKVYACLRVQWREIRLEGVKARKILNLTKGLVK